MAWPFRYCPACGQAGEPRLMNGNEYRCAACGWDYFHNTAAAAGIVLLCRGRLVLLRRRQEPGRGALALPGGFIDPDESAEAAAVRECREETGIILEPTALMYLASYPNSYFYKEVPYKTCDLFFLARTDAEPGGDTDGEAEEIYMVDPSAADPATLAFESSRRLFREHCQKWLISEPEAGERRR